MGGWENLITSVITEAATEAGLVALVLVFIGGVITSFSPCVLSMLPVMVGYIGGYSHPSKTKGFILSSVFVLGLGVTFSILGIIAASLGKIFGQIGVGWYYILGFVAIIMGLHLTEVINLNFPGLKKMPLQAHGIAGAFVAGLFFGLVASPCATPVLAVLISYVASKQALGYGALLLFTYGLGHGVPLIVVGTFTAALKSLPSIQHWSKYVNYVSGGILVLMGLYLLAKAKGLV